MGRSGWISALACTAAEVDRSFSADPGLWTDLVIRFGRSRVEFLDERARFWARRYQHLLCLEADGRLREPGPGEPPPGLVIETIHSAERNKLAEARERGQRKGGRGRRGARSKSAGPADVPYQAFFPLELTKEPDDPMRLLDHDTPDAPIDALATRLADVHDVFHNGLMIFAAAEKQAAAGGEPRVAAVMAALGGFARDEAERIKRRELPPGGNLRRRYEESGLDPETLRRDLERWLAAVHEHGERGAGRRSVRKRRGRPSDTNHARDAKVVADYKASGVRRYEDFARGRNFSAEELRNMVERVRKRTKKGSRTPE